LWLPHTSPSIIQKKDEKEAVDRDEEEMKKKISQA
jgi:hypothetical protein